MTRGGRISATRAAVFGLVAILASACASNARPAPISYGAARPPLAAAATAAPAPLKAPALDLTTRPFDDYSTPLVLTDQPPSECVPYARNLSGVQIWGDAVTWWRQAENKYVRSGRPAEGSVLVLRGGEVSINVPVVDVSAANDWSQVRVWHVPGGYWGGRTYEAQGFIHPYRLNGAAGLSG